MQQQSSCFVVRSANDIYKWMGDMPRMSNLDGIHQKKQPRRPHFLREWMDSKNLRAVDLAEELNIDKSLISRWLAGSTPSVDNQRILADFFGCEPEGLFRHPDDDWMARFLRDRPRDEVERIKQTLETAFPRKIA